MLTQQMFMIFLQDVIVYTHHTCALDLGEKRRLITEKFDNLQPDNMHGGCFEGGCYCGADYEPHLLSRISGDQGDQSKTAIQSNPFDGAIALHRLNLREEMISSALCIMPAVTEGHI